MSITGSRLLLVCFIALAMTVMHGTANPARADEFTLASVHRTIVEEFATVRHLSAEQLADRLQRSEDIVLFDVREDEEYAVSHLSGATRVDPGIWQRTFLNRHGDTFKGKTVVFYCSVGMRSSELAAKMQEALTGRGAKAIYNLQGGIFHWHNQQRPLNSGGALTSFVHPFAEYWGQLVARQNLLRYKPDR
ncbi:MAG: rhodanese-like domain-containing protein [Hyphomicrobiales bacterium]